MCIHPHVIINKCIYTYIHHRESGMRGGMFGWTSKMRVTWKQVVTVMKSDPFYFLVET